MYRDLWVLWWCWTGMAIWEDKILKNYSRRRRFSLFLSQTNIQISIQCPIQSLYYKLLNTNLKRNTNTKAQAIRPTNAAFTLVRGRSDSSLLRNARLGYARYCRLSIMHLYHNGSQCLFVTMQCFWYPQHQQKPESSIGYLHHTESHHSSFPVSLITAIMKDFELSGKTVSWTPFWRWPRSRGEEPGQRSLCVGWRARSWEAGSPGFLSQLIFQFFDEEKIIRALQQCVTICSSLITHVVNIIITILIVITLTQLCVHWGCKVTCVAPLYTHQVKHTCPPGIQKNRPDTVSDSCVTEKHTC